MPVFRLIFLSYFMLTSAHVLKAQSTSDESKVLRADPSLRFENGYWVLTMRCSNECAAALVSEYTGKQSIEMNAVEYERALLLAVYQGLRLQIDTADVELKQVNHRINSAFAEVKYISPRFPEVPDSLQVTFGCFQGLTNIEVHLTLHSDAVHQDVVLLPGSSFMFRHIFKRKEE